MALYLFDIDGTLIGGSVSSYGGTMSKAILEVFGAQTSIDLNKYHGFTDKLVMQDILAKANVEYDPKDLNQCLRLFGELFPDRPEGLIAIPAVSETIPPLSHSNVLGLLTGNVEVMARKKLRLFQANGQSLDSYFPFGGFGGTDPHEQRLDLFPIAINKAKRFGWNGRGNVYLIDDSKLGLKAAVDAQQLLTPANGFSIPVPKIVPIGVATGIYPADVLNSVPGVEFAIPNLKELPQLTQRLEQRVQ